MAIGKGLNESRFFVERPEKPIPVFWYLDDAIDPVINQSLTGEERNEAITEAIQAYQSGDLSTLRPKQGETPTRFHLLPLLPEEYDRIHNLSRKLGHEASQQFWDNMHKLASGPHDDGGGCTLIDGWDPEAGIDELPIEDWETHVPPLAWRNIGQIVLAITRGGPRLPKP